jgi:hypothetical protein
MSETAATPVQITITVNGESGPVEGMDHFILVTLTHKGEDGNAIGVLHSSEDPRMFLFGLQAIIQRLQATEDASLKAIADSVLLTLNLGTEKLLGVSIGVKETSTAAG